MKTAKVLFDDGKEVKFEVNGIKIVIIEDSPAESPELATIPPTLNATTYPESFTATADENTSVTITVTDAPAENTSAEQADSPVEEVAEETPAESTAEVPTPVNPVETPVEEVAVEEPAVEQAPVAQESQNDTISEIVDALLDDVVLEEPATEGDSPEPPSEDSSVQEPAQVEVEVLVTRAQEPKEEPKKENSVAVDFIGA